MISKEIEFLISRYDDPELSRAEREQLEAVLAKEPAAREMLREYQRLDQELARMPAAAVPSDLRLFNARVNQALDTVRVKRAGGVGLFLRRYAVPMAAAAAIILVVGVHLRNANQRPAPLGRGVVKGVVRVEVQRPVLATGMTSVELAVNELPSMPQIVHVSVAGVEDQAYVYNTAVAERKPGAVLWYSAQQPQASSNRGGDEIFFF